MRAPVIIRYVALVLLLIALMLGVSAGISYWYRDDALQPLLFTTILCILCGVFPLIFIPPAKTISNQEGLFIVVGSWLLACLVGALPYLMWGGEFTVTNAWFESVSGLTTTGSSILNNIEGLPKGLLFWRSSTHFLGGIGIVVFAIALLPGLGRSALVLFRTEISTFAREQFRVRVMSAMQVLIYVYVGLAILETLALMACGMNLFDAVTHSFATIATGGFSTRNLSVAAYNSPAIEAVIMLFMAVSGIHFGLLFLAFTGRPKPVWRSSAARYFIITLALAVGVVCFQLVGTTYDTWPDAVRYGAFQVLSLGTTTGFATADSSGWPAATQFILLLLMLQCACAGSTSGGIKTDRIVIMFKAMGRQFKKLRHPRAVIALKIDGKVVDDEVAEAALVFILLYLAVVVTGTLILAALGSDLLTSFSATVATMGNVGPGFGSVGSMDNFAALPAAAKWTLSFTMLCGRLEIYALLLFVFPRFWAK